MNFSGTLGSCLLARRLHAEFQRAEGGKWAIDSAEAAGSGGGCRLHRDHGCLRSCWQIQSLAYRLVSSFFPSLKDYFLVNDHSLIIVSLLLYAELKQAQSMMNALQWRGMKMKMVLWSKLEIKSPQWLVYNAVDLSFCMNVAISAIKRVTFMCFESVFLCHNVANKNVWKVKEKTK